LLGAYLASLPATSRFIFAGHSLGGALSGSLPILLLNSTLVPNLSAKNVFSYPTAGPSPGNANFAKLYASTLKMTGTGYQSWNSDLWNSIDIVPQAWCTITADSPGRNLTNPINFYGAKSAALTATIAADFLLLDALANKSGIVYIPLQGNSFQGTPPATVPQTVSDYLADAGNQHTPQYYQFIGIPFSPLPEGVTITEGHLSTKTSTQALASNPVFSTLISNSGATESK